MIRKDSFGPVYFLFSSRSIERKINRVRFLSAYGIGIRYEFRRTARSRNGNAERGREVDGGPLVLTKSVNGEVGVGVLERFLRAFSPRR